MLERIKTAILLLLVLSSLFLTGQHWTANLSYTPNDPSGGDPHQPQPLEVLAPWALYVHRPEGSAVFYPEQQGYQKSWIFFRQVVSGFHNVTIRQGNPQEWEALVNSGALEFRLAGRAQLRMWLESLMGLEGLSTEHFFSHLLISPDSTHVHFRDSHTSTYLVWEGVVPEEPLAEVFESVVQLEGQAIRPLDEPYRANAASWVYVPESPAPWPELWVKNEQARMTSIINSFFSDLSLVRRIVEGDGITTFSDSRRIVWADSHGGIEYLGTSIFTPRQDTQAMASLLLVNGISFVSRRGGWPAELQRRLKGMEVVTETEAPYVDFEFVTFYRDPVKPGAPLIPLVSWRKEIGLRVAAGGDVISYERFIYTPIPERLDHRLNRIIPAEVALKTILQELSDTKITSMYLAYYQRELILSEESLYPVWVVEHGSQRMMVNAYTGDIVTGP